MGLSYGGEVGPGPVEEVRGSDCSPQGLGGISTEVEATRASFRFPSDDAPKPAGTGRCHPLYVRLLCGLHDVQTGGEIGLRG